MVEHLTWLESLVLGMSCFQAAVESFARESKFRESTIKAVNAVGYATETQLERIAGNFPLAIMVTRIALVLIGIDLVWSTLTNLFS